MPLPVRIASRVLLVDEAERMLMLRSVDPGTGAVFWYPPGGGVETGEDPADAAVREVWEETGLQDVRIEGEVWRRRHRFTWGDVTYDQREHWFLARVEHFEAAPQALSASEQQEITEFRWWSLAEMDHTDDLLTPRSLASLLRELLAAGPPIGAHRRGRLIALPAVAKSGQAIAFAMVITPVAKSSRSTTQTK